MHNPFIKIKKYDKKSHKRGNNSKVMVKFFQAKIMDFTKDNEDQSI